MKTEPTQDVAVSALSPEQVAALKALKSQGRVGPVTVITWVMGALSFLNLIREISPLKLYGLVADWANAYNLFVKQVVSFLFGWIKFGWVSLDPIEGHIFVLGFILLSAYWRSYMRHSMANMSAKDKDGAFEHFKDLPADKIRSNLKYFVGIYVFFLVFTMLFFTLLLPAFLLPGIWGAIISGLVLVVSVLVICVSSLFARLDDDVRITLRNYFRELGAIVAAVLFIVVINYGFFAPK